MLKSKNNPARGMGVFLIFLGLLYFCYIVLTHSKSLFKKFDPILAEKIYSQSQWQQSQNISEEKTLDSWAIKNGNTGWKNYVDENKEKVDIEKKKQSIIDAVRNKGTSDSFLYGYAGYKYSTGTNPSLLNPEHPPLAKYIIGYSIQIFGSEHILGIVTAFFSLLLIACISYEVTSSLLLGGVALFVVSIFPLFTDQLVNGPQLELYQLFFFLLFVYFLLKTLNRKKLIFSLLSGVSFGLLLSTKTFLPFFILFSIWIVVSLWKRWKETFIIIGLGLTVFIASYFQFFALGGTLRGFLGLQKYIVVFYGNSHIPFVEFIGNYIRLIYTGSWKFWDVKRSISFYEGWNILWPILFTLGIVRVKSLWKKNISSQLLINFFILYNIFVCITPMFPRYLLLLYVPIIILI